MKYSLENELGREVNQQQTVRWLGDKNIEMNV